ncbi:MAG: BolA family protein [Burkholderiaceae bacterium]
MRPSIDELRQRLTEAFPSARVEVVDESHLHAGHAGAAGGAGHYRVRLVAAQFDGRALMARHRLVYDAVRDWMPDRIHALTIEARTPDEAG